MPTRTLRLLVPLLSLTTLALASARAAEQPAATQPGWHAKAKLMEAMARKKQADVFREEDVKPYSLPDPLVCQDGSRIADRAAWERKGRAATLDLFRTHVYGRAPAKPAEVTFTPLLSDDRALDGRATHRRVRITASDGQGKSFAFEASVLLPNDRPNGKRVPAFLLINNRGVASADPTRKTKDGFWPAEEIIARGYATAVFRTVDVDPDKDGPAARAQGLRGVWPAGSGKVGEDAWGTIAAWAWGASRVMDWLQTLPEIDAGKVAVIGHSRGGKTALWAAAEDPRFAVAISNDSGCGGAALSKRVFGETVADINRNFPYWFCENFKKYNDREERLPIDQHQLIALIAPRAVCVGSADEDLHADPRGEFLSLAHAAPVFALYGLPDFRPDEMPPLDRPVTRGQVSYHVRAGTHNLTPVDWKVYMDFADGLRQ
jgi:pimeloyl-ACP methyl ester carboxylesterase